MTYLTAVIVGDRFQAARAAADRKIPAAFVEEIGAYRGRRETVLRIGEQFLPDVASWLAETAASDITPGVGFPVGACLIYSTHEGGGAS